MTYPWVEFVTLFPCVSNVCGLDVIENESTCNWCILFYFHIWTEDGVKQFGQLVKMGEPASSSSHQDNSRAPSGRCLVQYSTVQYKSKAPSGRCIVQCTTIARPPQVGVFYNRVQYSIKARPPQVGVQSNTVQQYNRKVPPSWCKVQYIHVVQQQGPFRQMYNTNAGPRNISITKFRMKIHKTIKGPSLMKQYITNAQASFRVVI